MTSGKWGGSLAATRNRRNLMLRVVTVRGGDVQQTEAGAGAGNAGFDGCSSNNHIHRRNGGAGSAVRKGAVTRTADGSCVQRAGLVQAAVFQNLHIWSYRCLVEGDGDRVGGDAVADNILGIPNNLPETGAAYCRKSSHISVAFRISHTVDGGCDVAPADDDYVSVVRQLRAGHGRDDGCGGAGRTDSAALDVVDGPGAKGVGEAASLGGSAAAGIVYRDIGSADWFARSVSGNGCQILHHDSLSRQTTYEHLGSDLEVAASDSDGRAAIRRTSQRSDGADGRRNILERIGGCRGPCLSINVDHGDVDRAISMRRRLA